MASPGTQPQPEDPLTNLTKPLTSATITVRIIKSFEYRTEKSLVLHDLNLEEVTVGQLKKIAQEAILTKPGWKPYRTTVFDTLKLYTKAHGAKTTNLIINLDHDEWIMDDDDKPLASLGLENESEVSLFNREAYQQFKQNPETKWI